MKIETQNLIKIDLYDNLFLLLGKEILALLIILLLVKLTSILISI